MLLMCFGGFLTSICCAVITRCMMLSFDAKLYGERPSLRCQLGGSNPNAAFYLDFLIGLQKCLRTSDTLFMIFWVLINPPGPFLASQSMFLRR